MWISVSVREANSRARWDPMGCACISWAVMLSGRGSERETAGAENLVTTCTACWGGLYRFAPVDLMLISSWNTHCFPMVYFLVQLHPIEIIYITPVMWCGVEMKNLTGQVRSVGSFFNSTLFRGTCCPADMGWLATELHVVGQRGFSQLPDSSELMGESFSVPPRGYFDRSHSVVSTPPKVHVV